MYLGPRALSHTFVLFHASMAGRIVWVRHLLKMIELPMHKFRQHAALMISRDSKSIIKKYNQIAQAFVAYEVIVCV